MDNTPVTDLVETFQDTSSRIYHILDAHAGNLESGASWYLSYSKCMGVLHEVEVELRRRGLIHLATDLRLEHDLHTTNAVAERAVAGHVMSGIRRTILFLATSATVGELAETGPEDHDISPG